MKTISILGCGWLGLPLGETLVRSGYHVKGSTTKEEKLIQLQNVGIIPYQIQLEPHIKGEIGDFFESDIVVISIPPRAQKGDSNFYKQQMQAVLGQMKGGNSKVLFISSTAVYLAENNEVVEEDASPEAVTRAGIRLLEVEQVFTGSVVETTVLRFGGLYGPNRHPGKFLAGKVDLPGANNPINMIHLDDCMGVILSVLEQNAWEETFNACSSKSQNKASFYIAAAEDLELTPPVFSSAHQPFKKVSSKKLMDRIGYKFKY
jgi:nucleoside-diphosphate-sugar epimerase